jgi:superfamily II DNA or RNA helicase
VTATAEEDKTGWPEGVLFWPTWQIGFQTEYIARMYLMFTAMLAADMGTGKSIMALGVAGLCFEQQVIDYVLIVCEPNKLAEWPADVAKFTRLSAAVYHGPKRKRLLENLPQVLVTTYETCRDDVAVFPPKGSKSRTLRPGPLMEALTGKRVLVVYDEITKLGRRSSNLYKAHYWMLGQLRKGPEPVRVIGMSGTPMDTDLENIFNEMRLVVPSMPRVKDFSENVIKDRDPYGRPRYKTGGREWLRARVEPWILRKRKSDPDVQAMFPPLVEEFRRIRMHPDQYRIYRLLEDLAWDPKTHEHRAVPGLNALLRQLAGDPWAVLEAASTGESKLAAMVAEEMKTELVQCSSAKAEELVSMADQILAAGHKMMVFTFYGQTVLPALVRRLGDRPVFIYHGGLTQAEREHQKTLFKACQGAAILLSSDAGARGINMPELDYIAEYEAARTHATRQQRASRGHRLGKQDPLTFITLVLDSSIEGASAIRTLMRRNADQDYILGDDEAEGYVTADDRRELFAQARPRKAG